MNEERWAWWRAQVPAMERRIYVNTGFTGPFTRDVAAAMERRQAFELAEGPTTLEVTEEARETRARLIELFGEILGTPPERVALTTSTTTGISAFVNGLRLEPTDRLLTTSVEHGGGAVPLYRARAQYGCPVDFVSIETTDAQAEIAERFGVAIGDRTRVVVLSEISYQTGQVLPVKEIVRAAHRVGAVVVVDGAQTGGHIPIDVADSGVDAYAIPAQKWLCGPRGLGAVAVSAEALPLVQPLVVDGSYAAEWDLSGGFEPKEDVQGKIQTSAVSPVLAAGAVAAIEQYLASGPEAIWDRVRELTAAAEGRFEQIPGVTIASPRSAEGRSGLFCFRAEGIPSADLAPHLQRAHRIVCRAVREQDVVRLSFHGFNTEDDVEQIARAVEQSRQETVPAADPPAGYA